MAGPEKDKKVYTADPSILESYIGKYKMEDDVVVSVTKKNENLILEKSNRNFPLEIVPVSDTIFYSPAAIVKVRFVRNETGRAERLVLMQTGRTEFAERVRE
jgi:hypothetical protein